jgi:hypothetical protein
MIDPTCVADTFVEGVGDIEKIGASCVRATLYAKRNIGHGAHERVVVARLVLPKESFARMLRLYAAFAADEIVMDEDAPMDCARH